jgi:hypothetical protein
MRNAQFDEIVGNLTSENFDTLRGYILDVVRAEYGPLIQQIQEHVAEQPEAPTEKTEPENEDAPEMPEDPFVTQAPQSLIEFLSGLGLVPRERPTAQHRVIHFDLRF